MLFKRKVMDFLSTFVHTLSMSSSFQPN